MRASYRRIRWACAIAMAGVALGGCLLAVGGAAIGGTAVIMTDRRSSGIQLEDAQISGRVHTALDGQFARESVRIDVSTYDQEVLLAGQVPREEDRAAAERLAAGATNVHRVYNELDIGSLAGLSSSSDDFILDGKVKGALIGAKGLPPGVVKTTCTLGSVYLQGKVSAEEAELAKSTASRVSGVKRVVALFEVLTPEEYAKLPRQP
jgi:osmotically-inducible protein OsmY